jgi:hypothetical protein
MGIMNRTAAESPECSNTSSTVVGVGLVEVSGLDLIDFTKGEWKHIGIRNADPWTNFTDDFLVNFLASTNIERKTCAGVPCNVFPCHNGPSCAAQWFVTNEPMDDAYYSCNEGISTMPEE